MMNIFTDPITIFALFISAIAGFKLWQVLGQRGRVQKLPVQRFEAKPSPTDLELKAEPVKPRRLAAGFAEVNSPLAQTLETLGAKDAKFDTAEFLEKAKNMHEEILNAFGASDVAKLRHMLVGSIIKIFEDEIARRNDAGETSLFKFVGIKQAKLKDGGITKDAVEWLTVAFSTEVISAIKNKLGAIVTGSATRVVEVNEVWTFERVTGSGLQGWKLAETHDTAQ